MKNKKIKEALDYCKKRRLKKTVFAIPFFLSIEDVLDLKDMPVCNGLVLHHPDPKLTANSTSKWLGYFPNLSEWKLPEAKGDLIFIGSHLRLTRKMVTALLLSGRVSVVCKINGQFQKVMLHRFIFWRTGKKILEKVYQLPFDNSLRKALLIVATLSIVRSIWHRFFKRDGNLQNFSFGKDDADEEMYKKVISIAQKQSYQERINPVPGRVILVNAGLAAGGAERQIVNTLIGLSQSGQYESVALLAEYIQRAPELDFFLHELETRGIEVSQIEQNISLLDDGLSSLSPSLAEVVEDLPGNIIEDILNLVEEFRVRRPSIVHAWQDSTSIKVGLAALIAGVPRIVLSSRNVAPTNFAYHQDYMYPAYRALASVDSIVFINNSQAGAEAYSNWLEIPCERFIVLRNGVDLTNLKKVEDKLVLDYRRSLGIPDQALVVGSIFRFWAEKRPMLWLQSAKLIAKSFQNVHFLIIGEGPMRAEMENYIKSSGLCSRIHLPGSRSDIATPLSAMNIFLLTSKFEGTPNVALEAQWLGIPIISTDAGGAKEAFEQGFTGWIVNDSSPEAVSKELTKLIECPQLIENIETKGPHYVASHFSLQEMVKHTISIYEQILN